MCDRSLFTRAARFDPGPASRGVCGRGEGAFGAVDFLQGPTHLVGLGRLQVELGELVQGTCFSGQVPVVPQEDSSAVFFTTAASSGADFISLRRTPSTASLAILITWNFSTTSFGFCAFLRFHNTKAKVKFFVKPLPRRPGRGHFAGLTL